MAFGKSKKLQNGRCVMHTTALKCDCSIITSMFLSGADGKPELRAPSIKGAMRFWWRAMNGHLSPEDLKRKETAIFGGSGEKDGRSKVVIKIDKFPEYLQYLIC